MKSLNFVFTLNNYTDAHEEAIAALYASDACKYIKYGKEKGESGTPHLQGMIGFKTQRRLNAVIKKLPGAHVEIMKGRVDQSNAYVSKDGDCTVFGTLPMTSKAKGKKEKERWTRALSAAKAGNFDEIDDDIRVRYYRTFKLIAHDYAAPSPDLDILQNEWIYGPPGTGKTYSVKQRFPGHFWKQHNRWWCNYKHEPVVVIEDLGMKFQYLGEDLKNWADKYQFSGEIKGGSMMLRPERIIVTSNYHPSDIWTDEKILLPIYRRFKIIHRDTPYEAPPEKEEKENKKRKREEDQEPQVSRPGSWAPGFKPVHESK